MLISVGATLAVIAIAAALFHFCRTKAKTPDEEEDRRAALSSGNYAQMQH